MATTEDSRKQIQNIAQKALDISNAELSFLGRGATSIAWRASMGEDSFIIRIMPSGANRPVTYQSEFTILRLLRKEGCPVPEPILNSAGYDEPLPEVTEAWTITRAVAGQAILKEFLPSKAAYELGQLLAQIHRVTVHGYGRLREQPNDLCGLQSDMRAGVVARLCWAKLWPLDASSLERHPVAKLMPSLVAEMRRRELDIQAAATEPPATLAHADLHGEHIFTNGPRLSGLIDFGAAFIGSPSWDFASLAFYHGWKTVGEVLVGYTASQEERTDILERSKLLALILSLYKLDKAVTANAPQKKIDRIVMVAATTLGLLDGR